MKAPSRNCSNLVRSSAACHMHAGKSKQEAGNSSFRPCGHGPLTAASPVLISKTSTNELGITLSSRKERTTTRSSGETLRWPAGQGWERFNQVCEMCIPSLCLLEIDVRRNCATTKWIKMICSRHSVHMEETGAVNGDTAPGT